VVSVPPPYVTRSGRTVNPSAKAASYVVYSSQSLELTFNTQRDDEIALDEALVLFFSLAGSASLMDSGIFAAPLVPSSSLVPVPSTKGKEQSLRAAVRERSVAPTAVEVAKQLRLGAIGRDFSLRELPSNAKLSRIIVILVE